MEEEEIVDFDKFLKVQFVLCMQIVFNVEYIKRHITESKATPVKTLNVDYLNYIGRLVSDDTISSIYKLLNKKQDYSFHKVIGKVDFLKSKGYRLKDETNYENFKKTLEELSKLYEEENLNNLRDKYVSHIDIKRVQIPFNVEQISLIQEKTFQALNEINLAFREEKI